MTDVVTLHRGSVPLLVSVPHDGRAVPGPMRSRMTEAALELPDTDWHVGELYAFARDMGASMIVAQYSRYVVDLNRSADDEVLYPGRVATGLCPEYTFAGDAIYLNGGVAGAEKSARVDAYWRPYHDALAAEIDRLRNLHGAVLLWDAHSITSSVPRLFDGELPVLNVGTNEGRSCADAVREAARAVCSESPYEWVVDGRFKGGYITRRYGQPERGVHAVQLELAQRAYMDERTLQYDPALSETLRQTLRALLTRCLRSATA